jgi:hypothetical protein
MPSSGQRAPNLAAARSETFADNPRCFAAALEGRDVSFRGGDESWTRYRKL